MRSIQIAIAGYYESPKKSPRRTVVAHDAIVTVAAHQQVGAEAEPVFQGLDSRPLGSTTTSRQPTEGRAVCPLRPVVVGTRAQGCEQQSKPGHVKPPSWECGPLTSQEPTDYGAQTERWGGGWP